MAVNCIKRERLRVLGGRVREVRWTLGRMRFDYYETIKLGRAGPVSRKRALPSTRLDVLSVSASELEHAQEKESAVGTGCRVRRG